MSTITKKNLHQINSNLWEISPAFRKDMLVPARVYASSAMLDAILAERALEQLVNMTTLPGIVKYALAMPDIHQGYGFPIGGVAAFRKSDGVISPGGVGYDINCGVRFLASNHTYEDIQHYITPFANQLQRSVPSGVGSSGKLILDDKELAAVLNNGARWALDRGDATPEDLLCLEEGGCYESADDTLVSFKAKQRGHDQLGTLGSGNHFVEVQKVVEILDEKIAAAFGLFLGQITIMIHTGSRGLGHQVCTDYVQLMNKSTNKFGIALVDRELACAPFSSNEGQRYFQAMAAAANFAWANRQMITAAVRQSWINTVGGVKEDWRTVYDVAHNIAKIENHGGKELIVHRKGATRAFGPGHEQIPERYRKVGQPVIIPGSMGTSSYILCGTNEAMEHTFGSACHGAGRSMSRTKAKKILSYQELRQQLANLDITVRAGSIQGLVEEAPEAYKDVEEVVGVVAEAGIAHKIAKMKPVAIIKG